MPENAELRIDTGKTRVRFVSGRTRVFPMSTREFEHALVSSAQKGIPFVAVPHLRGKVVIQIGSIETFETAIEGDKDSND